VRKAVSEKCGSGNLIDEGADITRVLKCILKNLLRAAWNGSACHTLGITGGSCEHGN